MKWSDSGGGDFEQAPAGTHVARCIKLLDLGTQFGEYQGKPNALRKVVISWELPNEIMTEGDYAGKPFIVSKFYTASLGDKANLRKDLVNWRGREFTEEELAGFESKNILGKPCMVQITPNDKGKNRVTGVMALMKGTECPPQVNPPIYFSLEREEFDARVMESLSEYYQELIKKSPEFEKLGNKPDPVSKGSDFDDFKDDIPF